MDRHPFVQKVGSTIKRHGMIPAGTRVLVGVSGGADSVCLVRALDALGCAFGIAHIDHGLRGEESRGDAAFVRELASRLSVRLFESRIDAGQMTGNLEAGARAERHEFLERIRRSEGFDRIALAHTRDDRIETFFLNLLRGAGPAGLVAMAPVREPVVRPLIEATLPEIEDYLSSIGQDWREDRSNADTRFARNRIRHQVLPWLSEEFNPRLGETLARTIEVLSEEDAWMEAEAAAWLAGHFRLRTDPALVADDTPVLEIGDLASRPVAFIRRVLRAALRRARPDLTDIGFERIEQVRTLLAPGKSGRRIQLPGPVHVERSFDTLSFRSEDHLQVAAGYEYELPIPGRVRVPEAGLEFSARVVPASDEGAAAPGREGTFCRVRVDGESLGPCVKIRNWKKGDTYDAAGLGRAKLKTLFQDEKVPRSARSRWPVLVAHSTIVWVASFPVSGQFAPTERSRRLIEFEASPSRG